MYLKFFILGCGIFLLVLGAVFSLIEHTPPFTVHSFTYDCVFTIEDSRSTHGNGFLSEKTCYYHGSLSVIVSCIIGAGAFLTFSGLKNIRLDRRITMRTFVIPAIFGVVILIMIFAVLSPIASCRAESECIYDDTPYPSKMSLEILERFFMDKYDKGEITIADMKDILDREGYSSLEIEEFLAERILLDRP